VIIVGTKYKLLDEDIAKVKESVISLEQIKIDHNTEFKISKIIVTQNKIQSVVLNLDKPLPDTLQTFLKDLERKQKIKIVLFSEFLQQYLDQCPLDVNSKDLRALLDIQNSSPKWLGKRVFDIIFSIFALVVALPVGLIVALIIKIKSPEGPIFFTQERLGHRGKKFRVFKFRTMVPNAEEILEKMLRENKKIRQEYFKYRKLKNDPRIIPVIGNFLRKTSLDELPQFLNVLLGDMSVVGPRPYIQEEFYRHSHLHVDLITSVKPGITGYWQTSGRNLNTFDERVNCDIEYISKQNLKLDIKIILQTVSAMILKRGV